MVSLRSAQTTSWGYSNPVLRTRLCRPTQPPQGVPRSLQTRNLLVSGSGKRPDRYRKPKLGASTFTWRGPRSRRPRGRSRPGTIVRPFSSPTKRSSFVPPRASLDGDDASRQIAVQESAGVRRFLASRHLRPSNGDPMLRPPGVGRVRARLTAGFRHAASCGNGPAYEQPGTGNRRACGQ